LSNAYEQIRIVKKDIWKTAFSIVYGTYISRVMQQGNCSAPTAFQQLMTHLFQEHISNFMHVYLDDIFVYSDTVKEHKEHLQRVFSILRKAELYLETKKCDLYSKQIECLGHIIDNAGIHAELDKMEHIQNWQVPRNTKDL
jgi:hypothetical protein